MANEYIITADNLNQYDKETIPYKVRGMVKEAFDGLTEEQKQGLIVVTDEEGPGGESSGSSGEVYSTEETRIGTWIDGKPLYRKVFNYTITQSSTDWIQIAPFIEGITIVKMDANVERADLKVFSPLPYGSSLGTITTAVMYSYVTSSAFSPGFNLFNTADSFAKNGILTVIYEYTKTTD